MRTRLIALVGAWFALLAIEPVLAQVPRIERPVTDAARVLAAGEVAELEARLLRLAKQTGVQASVLVASDTAGLPLEDFSLAVAESWGGGSLDSDRGLLLVLATRRRAMRLELGYGLEERLPDGVARSLLDAAGPALRQERWSEALGIVLKGVEVRTAGLVPDADLPGTSAPLGSRLPYSYLIVLGLAAVCAHLVGRKGGVASHVALLVGAPSVVAFVFREGDSWWWVFALTWSVGAGATLALSALRRERPILAGWMMGGFVCGALLSFFLPMTWQDGSRADDVLALLAVCVGSTLLALALPYLSRHPWLLFQLIRILSVAAGTTYGPKGRLPSSGDWGGGGGGFGGGGANKRW